MSIKIDEAITSYLNMRQAIEVESRKAKDFASNLKDKMDLLEKYIHKKLDELNIDSFKAKGVGTAFKASKDYVKISDKEAFKKFLAERFLMALQSLQYKTSEGAWQPDGEDDLKSHTESLLNSGAFDLLTVAANKNNCKAFMTDNDGIMPEGVDYTKELVIQFRKGK